MAINTFYDDIRAEIEAQIQSTAAAIIPSTTGQFFTSLQALKMNLLEKLAKGQAALAGEHDGPYIVVDMGAMVDCDDAAVNQEAKRLPVTIFVIDRSRKGRDDQNYVNGWARAIGLVFDSPSAAFTNFQPIERHSSDSSAAQNAYEILEQNKSHIFIAAVSWSPGFLCGEL